MNQHTNDREPNSERPTTASDDPQPNVTEDATDVMASDAPVERCQTDGLDKKSRKATFLAAGAFTLAAIGAISDVGGVRDMLRELWGIEQSVPNAAIITMSLDEYEERQRQLRVQIEAELEQSSGSDAARLTAALMEVERRLSDSEASYQQAIRELETLQAQLLQLGSDVDETRLREAQNLLARGQTSAADIILSEIEQSSENAVDAAARAALARGEIAEQDLRWKDASEHYERAAELAPTFERVRKARVMLELSGDVQGATSMGQRLLELANETDQPGEVALALNEYASSLVSSGDYRQALTAFRRSEALTVQVSGEDSGDHAAVLSNIGNVQNQLGLYPEAEATLGKALSIMMALETEDSLAVSATLNNLANSLSAQNRLDEAAQYHELSLELLTHALGETHPFVADGLNNLARVFARRNDHAMAIELLEKALEIDRQNANAMHPSYAQRQSNLGMSFEAVGRFEDAEAAYLQAISVTSVIYNDAHPDHGINLANYASLLSKTGRRAEALQMLQDAHEIMVASFPAGHPYILAVENGLSQLRR